MFGEGTSRGNRETSGAAAASDAAVVVAAVESLENRQLMAADPGAPIGHFFSAGPIEAAWASQGAATAAGLVTVTAPTVAGGGIGPMTLDTSLVSAFAAEQLIVTPGRPVLAFTAAGDLAGPAARRPGDSSATAAAAAAPHGASAAAAAPALALDSRALTFDDGGVNGDVAVLVLRNLGRAPLTIPAGEMSIAGGDAGHFAASLTPDRPLVLPPGGSARVAVVFTPGAGSRPGAPDGDAPRAERRPDQPVRRGRPARDDSRGRRRRRGRRHPPRPPPRARPARHDPRGLGRRAPDAMAVDPAADLTSPLAFPAAEPPTPPTRAAAA